MGDKTIYTDKRDATCGKSNETDAFKEYIGKCRASGDKDRATTFFNQSLDTIKGTFEKLRAEGDNLIYMGKSMNSLTSLSGNSINGVNIRIKDLQNQVKELQTTKNNYLQHSKSADKSFLEEVMNGTPQAQTAPSLQDATLLLFWFGWIVMIFTLIAVRWFSPGGSWQAGLFTLFLLLLVTACLYSLLIQIA